MKKISAVACCVVAACMGATVLLAPKKAEHMVLADGLISNQNITINETNFPDEGFREAIRKYDTDRDGVLKPGERNKVRSEQ